MLNHLEVYSEYSLRYGICRIKDVVDRCVADNIHACALTDYQNIFAWVKFYQTATKNKIKPICAARITLKFQKHYVDGLLYCLNNQGYQSLLQHLSHIYLRPNNLRPCVDASSLKKENTHGLVWALLPDNPIDDDALSKIISWSKDLFHTRFYMVTHGCPPNTMIHPIYQWIKKANACQVPLLGCRPTYYLNATDYEAHEARVAIHDGVILQDPQRTVRTPDEYWLNHEKMQEIFKHMPTALTNSEVLAEACHVSLDIGTYHLPRLTTLKDQSSANHLHTLSHQGLDKRLQQENILEDEHPSYHQRLNLEINTINDMGFPDYFLIVADFISWSKKQKIPVGPGRGSGAGSLVAYALGITDLNPMTYGLLFERFLNPERVSMPDFDIDFCMNRRDEVIEYVSQEYGQDSVSQIITYGTMAAKGVIRDVGRVLGHPYGFVDQIAKLIPFELGMTIEKALRDEPALLKKYQEDNLVQGLVDMSRKLEGIVRNVGRHAGGVVIAPKPLTEFTALYADQQEHHVVSQFDKDDIEKIGLVKFDFLGLRTLTIIQWAIDNARQQGHDIDIQQIPLDDKEVYSLLSSGYSTGLFQLESTGMQDLLRRLKPDHFEDVIALVALYRPGPLQSGMVDDFISRKHGLSEVVYQHPSVANILQPTYGVILYQEQVMQIAQTLAGYSLGGADLLRRAMGKKKPEEMAAQRKTFIKGATAKEINEDIANNLFDLIEKFAGYGFNKSHSAAYALISYQTGWLKAHYPDAFMAAVLSSDMDNTDKLVLFIEETKRMNLSLLPPSINASHAFFTIEEPGNIRYGLAAIKGIGTGLASTIYNEAKQGPFKDPVSFLQRMHPHKCNKKSLEVLIKAGACDDWNINRGILFASIERVFAEYEHWLKHQHQQDLFQTTATCHNWQVNMPWSLHEALTYERQVLGWYMTQHPITPLMPFLNALNIHSSQQKQSWQQGSWVVGVLHQVRKITTRSGQRGAILTLEDHKGRTEIALFAEVYQRSLPLLDETSIMLVQLQIRTLSQGQKRISCQQLIPLSSYLQRYPPDIHIQLHYHALKESPEITELLRKMTNGKSTLCVTIAFPDKTISWSKKSWIDPNPDWLEKINQFTNFEMTMKQKSSS